MNLHIYADSPAKKNYAKPLPAILQYLKAAINARVTLRRPEDETILLEISEKTTF